GHWQTGRCLPTAGAAQLPAGFTGTPFESPAGSHATFSSTAVEPTCEPAREGQACCPGRTAGGCQTDDITAGICLMGKCRAAPACVLSPNAPSWNSCKDLLGQNTTLICVPPKTAQQGWCVFNPNKQCSSPAECPYTDKTCTPPLYKLYLGAPGSA